MSGDLVVVTANYRTWNSNIRTLLAAEGHIKFFI